MNELFMTYLLGGIYMLGFGFVVLVYTAKEQKKVLLYNALCALVFLGYFVLQEAWAASVSMVAAGSGSAMQLYFVCKGYQSKSRARLVASLIFTLIGIAAVYSGPPDFYIILAVAASRLGELSDDQRHIKLGYMMAEGLWFVYAAEVGMVSVYWGCFVMLLFVLWQLAREYRDMYYEYKSTSYAMA